MDRTTSEFWTAILFHPNTRCAICGLPNKMISAYRRRGWPWFLGRREGAGSHPRLTLDHINPGRNADGFRPLCIECNRTRRAAQYTDEEVLLVVRDKWLWFSTPRFLWWLNTSPGVGGRLHRSERCAKRDSKFAARRLA